MLHATVVHAGMHICMCSEMASLFDAMTRTATRIYGDRDPREIPAYPLVEAARYAGVPLSTLRSWVGERKDIPRVIEMPDDSRGQLSFYNLVEAFVLGGLRRKHKLPLQQLRRDLLTLRELHPDVRHPLADLDLATFARSMFVESEGDVVNVSRGGQLGIHAVLAGVLQRVEKGPTGAQRLFPLTRADVEKSPRLVVIDPRIAFGRPVIAGTGIPTAVIHERWKAGDSVVALAEDYDRTSEEIEEALRYEAA
ncbi:MAG TPA: DUF433 domain-containing protein [Thermoanaerobaculia bacterium]